jgi:hypothetical protein
MATRYTRHYQIPVPDFLTAPWHATIQQAFDRVDAAIYDPSVIVSDDELLFWKNRAALLDPRAMVTQLPPFDVTVPADEVWFLIDGFLLDAHLYNGSTTGNLAGDFAHWERRGPHYEQALPIGPGKRLINFIHDGFTVNGALTYCRPSIVWAADARYTQDPRGLYYERINKLDRLEIRQTWCRIPEGSASGTRVDTLFDWTGAEDALYGIGRAVSTSDAAWIFVKGLGADGVTPATLSLTNEITDTHGHRLDNPCIFPFVRKNDGVLGFTGVKMAAGNRSGDPADLSGADAAGRHGYGVFTWSALPNDW